MASSVLSPFVHWAQTETGISLRVELRNVKTPEVDVTENQLEFTASGIGAKGENVYHFVLDFYKTVLTESAQYRITDREVEFSIKKETAAWWPRIVAGEKKPAWLKVDFDKLITEDDEDEEDKEENFANSLSDVLKELEDHKKNRKKVEDFRKIYLLLYNTFQFVSFLCILILMTIRYTKEGPFSMDGTYEAVGKTMKFCQILQLMEVVHPLLRFTKGSILMPLIQITGRLIILFVMIDAEPRMQTKPVVFYLFLVYSLIEVVRYPYYMLKIYDINISFITWLRYTIWIPLYPLGFVCEGVIILRNIPYFEETGKFSVNLPNPWNVSFSFPTVMRVYLLIGFFPMLFYMMTHMYRQRVKIIGPKSWKTKKE
ncbi:very-long-chain (3R)-3-hydroxyacyl-CoA dehydratase-like [Limulus polyphemus]|uniref:Very-long-chain (3R)-3-hydroxyacyl-CoA dehydratase n=1 Tax=Limulus polyphemus TaxID=6850 RepID=A0ABM1BRP1_LIMPO|nr:very-long-chain (3R)-3-hydroxyacyl-CoA dehydratase-like [Limulus polyphemus]